MNRFFTVFLSVIILFGITLAPTSALELNRDVTYKQEDGVVNIIHNEKTIAKYVYNDVDLPYIYPLKSLSGTNIAGSSPGLWIGHGEVKYDEKTGAFWPGAENAGKIVQHDLGFDSPSPGHWNIHAKLDWKSPDGNILMQEDRRYSFLTCDLGLIISIKSDLRASRQKQVDIMPGKDSFLACSIGLDSVKVTNNLGNTGETISEKPVFWCDATGKHGGKTAGITVYSIATNPMHPCYFMYDNDTLMANPFYTKEELNGPIFTVNPSESETFMYIVLVHDKELSNEALDAFYKDVAGGGKVHPSYKYGPGDTVRMDDNIND